MFEHNPYSIPAGIVISDTLSHGGFQLDLRRANEEFRNRLLNDFIPFNDELSIEDIGITDFNFGTNCNGAQGNRIKIIDVVLFFLHKKTKCKRVHR